MASPHVAGGAGQVVANSSLSNKEVRQQLKDTAEDIGLSDNESGAGLLDAENAVDSLGSTDGALSVSWVNPIDGETVSGTVTVQIDTSDSEDSDDSLDVTYNVDGGSSRSTSYNSTSGYYEYSWYTTAVSDADGDLDSVDLTLTEDSTGETEATTTVSVSGDSASDTTRLVAAGDDGSGNDYTADATVTDSAGNTGSGSTTVSETESTNAAPTVRIDALNNRSNPRWDRYEVDWSAADEDGNLDTVAEMLDSSGNTLDPVTNDVSGSSASGVDEVRSESNGTDIVVTATDTDGESGSDSQSM